LQLIKQIIKFSDLILFLNLHTAARARHPERKITHFRKSGLEEKCDPYATQLIPWLIFFQGGFTHSPHAQIVTTGCQQVWIHSLGVWDPHKLCGRVGVIKGVPANEF